MAECAANQQPYWNAGNGVLIQGSTQAQVCEGIAALLNTQEGGGYTWAMSEGECRMSWGGNEWTEAINEACTPSESPPATGTVVQCTGACTVTHEFKNTGNPFVMSVNDGLLVSAAIFGCWVIAWGFRQLTKAVAPDHDGN